MKGSMSRFSFQHSTSICEICNLWDKDRKS